MTEPARDASPSADPEPHLFRNYRRLPASFVGGRGCWLTETGGRRVLDFVGGIAVSSLGHGHPALVDALREQAGRYLHVSNLYHIPEQTEAAALLTGASGLDRAFFCNSGAEAVEAGIKLARRWGGTKEPAAHEIVVAEGSFHGRTLGALAAADLERDAGEVTRRCLELGLLVNAVGPHTLRLTPPLVVSEDEVDRAVGMIERALDGDRACSGPGGVGASLPS